jgi:type 1 glutamine amidotransferase
MARHGKNVALVRDLTDTMYNPERSPYASHFTGTDLIVEHIEKFVCPTITSNQLLGGAPFRFKQDTRPHVVMLIAEDEYETHKTLPAFAGRFLGKDFRVSMVYSRAKDPNDLPGLDVVDNADVLLVSVRRRLLKTEQLDIIRRYVQAGKPVVGIRTASHAFATRGGPTPPGHAAWPEFDRDVLGGNYHGHYSAKEVKSLGTTIRIAPSATEQGLLTGLGKQEFRVPSWLYKTSPLATGTTVLLMGRMEGGATEQPVAWTFMRKDGGRTFYCSLGHPEDFVQAYFQRLLLNGISWAARRAQGASTAGRK